MWLQKQVFLTRKTRGFHLITSEITAALPELEQLETGLLHLFLQHTSASLCINENADPSVREDMEAFFLRMVPENEPYYTHVYEGPDDLPAHIKSVVIGAELTIPVSSGRLALGTWQGIYLGEHRKHGGQRVVLATIQGQGG